MRHKSILVILLLMGAFSAHAQNVGEEFTTLTDSLQVLLEARTGVHTRPLRVSKVLRRGKELDFYFKRELGDYPWREDDVPWLRTMLDSLMPASRQGMRTGRVFCERIELKDLITAPAGNNGYPDIYRLSRGPDPVPVFVTRRGAQEFSKGLRGRNIALWQSHGRYYDANEDAWRWQRPPLHRTTEDLLTQSFVLPFLIPMLENAGAYVMTPRERDTNAQEYVIDNDPAFEGERPLPLRQSGRYEEKGSWSTAGAGFADVKRQYTGNDNPFTMGTARQAACIREGRSGKAEIRWTPDIAERGTYAVYVSYKSLPQSTGSAHYRISHMGGQTEFLVNQRLGGGTWVYLGSFEFAPGENGYIALDNTVPSGRKLSAGDIVTADAVRIGGGMGKIARGPSDTPDSLWRTSGLPSYLEGALYSMQWSGVDSTITRKWDGDYTQDYASRGAWTESLVKDRGIPVDLSLGIHSDAGVTPCDSIVGTLAIYTYREDDGTTVLPDGRSRMVCRTYADIVQSQICSDMQALYEPLWRRREIWDRSYSESRTTKVPGLLLEMFSHQNFADMRLAHDPSFKFAMSRAIYKGVLKYLAAQYGVHYAVQPLPVQSFEVSFAGGGKTARLSWEAVSDPLEPTAEPNGYILQTRVSDGAFDEGRVIKARQEGSRMSFSVPIEPGRLYSFRIIAFNDGGRSFPSEVLCIGKTSRTSPSALVVNNFTRVSGPAWFDAGSYAGFLGDEDGGVPYISDISLAGENYELRRSIPWTGDLNAGFGASRTDMAGTIVPGNTFDFVSIHAAAALAAGYDVCSSSVKAFCDGYAGAAAASASASAAGSSAGARVLDLLCGKQLTTIVGRGVSGPSHQVLPPALQHAIGDWLRDGGRLIISGANIATDLWDSIFPMPDGASAESTSQNGPSASQNWPSASQNRPSAGERAAAQEFAKGTLGYRWISGHGSQTGEVRWCLHDGQPWSEGCTPEHSIHIKNRPGGRIYGVENPDAIAPASKNGSHILMRYADTNAPAAVMLTRPSEDGTPLPQVLSFGFPLECADDPALMTTLFKLIQ
ncbi:MAG: N-acetylmuramoyl-L-alanine amidase [Bacteroidales bacterium]|nr:N-acetylmuramoyl-L-alanine amidase [Bacteroidales bacterium]